MTPPSWFPAAGRGRPAAASDPRRRGSTAPGPPAHGEAVGGCSVGTSSRRQPVAAPMPRFPSGRCAH